MRNKAVFSTQIKLNRDREFRGLELFESIEAVSRDIARIYQWTDSYSTVKKEITKIARSLTIGDYADHRYHSGTIRIRKLEIKREK